MGRNLKTKTGGAPQKRRKKSEGLSADSSSPVLSATSSSGGTSMPSPRECDKCGNNMLLDGVAKTWPLGKKNVAFTDCQICDFVAFRRSQRPCVQCTRMSCDHFCEWCGKGFHIKCAKLQKEDVENPNGFCCHKCEAEQSEGHNTDDEETKGEEDVGSRCGRCRLPFASMGKEIDDVSVATGFKVNQAVLVDNDEVLYNALITEVDTKGERIKIHFTRWSKSFDDWYAMDDEHINESLACDCCNNWFHIGCLPPIKSSGRWKDSTYVCPRCIDDARAFHNGSRAVLKAKMGCGFTSIATAKATKKTTSPKESERTIVAVVKTKKSNKAVVVRDDDDDDMEKKKENDSNVRKEKGKITKAPSKKKRILPEAGESSVRRTQAKENERTAKSAVSAASDLETVVSLARKEFASADAALHLAGSAPSEAKADSSIVRAPTTEVVAKVNAKVPKLPAVNTNAVVAGKTSVIMHASPEHTVKVVTEADSSPFEVAATVGANDKHAVGESDADPHERKLVVTSQTAAPEHSNRYSSCNTVMSLLNSPPSNETSIKTFKPTVTSLPMLSPADNTYASSSKPAVAMQTNFQVYVKMEQKNGHFSLYPRPALDGKPAQAGRKEVSTKLAKSAAARRTKQSQTCRGLSAFDILREVAAQEIDEGAVPVKPKREKRPLGREFKASASKFPKMDASTGCASSTTPGRTASSGGFGNLAVSDMNQSPQTRDRIQMNPFVDLHFSIRKEMYLRFCRLEEEGMLTRDSAHLLRSLIYPTSERFQDLKFVYLVNKDLPSLQLTKRLLEAVPYPATAAKTVATTAPHASSAAIRSPVGGKSLAGFPMSMGMFSAAMSRNSSPAGSSRMSLLPPPPGPTLLRPDLVRPDESSRVVPQSQQHPSRTSGSPATHVTTAKRPEMLIVEQHAPTRSPGTGTGSQRLLNSR
ncbi:unnamed protein product [Peronospora farinosa]|uniref:PHD-type domain-containing protein n=1 Tax=Peronospora farinosa TaxID=134698 RepID=A0AAV0TYK6_9STRA|nr:unnamed protein product [Peronospora farinosa]